MTIANLTAEIQALRQNKIVMNFVELEARKKVAEEIRAKEGGGTTAKAVELLEMRYENIRHRVMQYVAAGLVACLMAKYK